MVSYAVSTPRKRPLRLHPTLNMVHVLLWKVYRWSPQTLGWDLVKVVNRNGETVNSNQQWEPVIGLRGSKPVTPFFKWALTEAGTTWGVRELRRVVDSKGPLCKVLFHRARFPKPTQCKRLNDSTKDVSWINQTDHCQPWSSSWNSPGPVPTHAAWISTKSRFQSRFQVKLINAWPDPKLECLW